MCPCTDTALPDLFLSSLLAAGSAHSVVIDQDAVLKNVDFTLSEGIIWIISGAAREPELM